MKTLFTALLCVMLTGCLGIGISEMSPEQIRASNGMMSCTNVNSMYGKASGISVNADDIRKGATATGKTEITCGEAKMTIEITTTVPALLQQKTVAAQPVNPASPPASPAAAAPSPIP